MSQLSRLWYLSLHWAAVKLYYHRITVLHPERLPDAGPTLFLGLHRNGAVDGFIYNVVCRPTTAMVAGQLRRSLLGRVFFGGIEVVRDKDADTSGAAWRASNRQALEACCAVLAAGGALFVLPEGTSDLGPRHLPFKRGAARILERSLASGIPLQVVPLGLHYERAWAFQSNVELIVGAAIDTSLDPGLSEAQRLSTLHARITQALEQVGVNLRSAAEQQQVEKLAYSATLGTGITYFDALKSLQRGLPATLSAQLEALDRKADRLGLARHQGVPLVPIGHAWAYVLGLAVLGPLAVAALLLNLPPALAGWWAARKFADARNVIALWRLLVGLPALVLWTSSVLAATLLAGKPAGFALYAALSIAGLRSTYRVRKLAVSVVNLARGRALRPHLLDMHRALRQTVERGR